MENKEYIGKLIRRLLGRPFQFHQIFKNGGRSTGHIAPGDFGEKDYSISFLMNSLAM